MLLAYEGSSQEQEDFLELKIEALHGTGWGMAVYTPICTDFLAGMAGEPGGEASDKATSYIAPIKKVRFNKHATFEYTCYLLIGELKQMREGIYEFNPKVNE